MRRLALNPETLRAIAVAARAVADHPFRNQTESVRLQRFDQYRQHYAQPVVPGQTRAWLTHHAGHGRLTVFTAHIGENLAGLATTVALSRPCG